MIVLGLAAVVLAALLVAVVVPRDALATSRTLGRRADGTVSEVRKAREAVHRRRYTRRGVVAPVVLVAAVALTGVLADVYTPWTRLATVFGTSTSETALLSEEQVERVRQQERRERVAREAAEGNGVSIRPPSRGTGFWLDHWPLRPLFVLLLGLAVWRAWWMAVAQHRAYVRALRLRHREYYRYDLTPHDEPEAEASASRRVA